MMATKKVALGRGLGALFPSEGRYGAHAGMENIAGRIFEVEVDLVTPNPYQPRQDFGDEGLESLARSIKQLGVVQPITVRALGDGRFQTIAGERRLRAARRIGLTRVPAFVRVANAEEMLEMALVENVQREELNPVEVALGYERLIAECGLRQAQVAERVGKTRSTVANFLRLLRLPPRIQVALRERAVSVGHARALLGVPEKATQLQLFDEIQRNNLSVRQIEARVQQLHKKPRKTAPKPKATPVRPSLQIKEFEKSLRTRFSTRVRLRHESSGKGRIELHYFSADDLERVLELLLPRE